nr:structure-specific endonuclease subunit SLX1 homolog [Ipomoea batatas]
MATPLSSIFKSVKPHHPVPKPKPNPSSSSTPSKSLPIKSSQSPSSSSPPNSASKSKSNSRWSVYLILSTNPPIKTYVGVTTNFSRRLKEHNGELKGGAKASRAGRPWICACLIRGFMDRSEACAFETRWKQVSRKLPRKGKGNEAQKLEETKSVLLLKHRYTALDQVKDSIDCSHLKIVWHSNPY